jgi:hypothetical protein
LVSDSLGPTPPVAVEELEAIECYLGDILDLLLEPVARPLSIAPHGSSDT